MKRVSTNAQEGAAHHMAVLRWKQRGPATVSGGWPGGGEAQVLLCVTCRQAPHLWPLLCLLLSKLKGVLLALRHLAAVHTAAALGLQVGVPGGRLCGCSVRVCELSSRRRQQLE